MGRFPLSIPQELKERARAAAKRDRRSLNFWINEAIRLALGETPRNPPQEPEAAPGEPPKKKPPKEPRPAPEPSQEAVQFVQGFVSGMQHAHPSWDIGSETRLRSWERHADLMLRRDGRKPEEAIELARWLFDGACPEARFWQPNIMGMQKFREKYDQLQAQRRRSAQSSRGRGPLGEMMREAAGVLGRDPR